MATLQSQKQQSKPGEYDRLRAIMAQFEAQGITLEWLLEQKAKRQKSNPEPVKVVQPKPRNEKLEKLDNMIVSNPDVAFRMMFDPSVNKNTPVVSLGYLIDRSFKLGII